MTKLRPFIWRNTTDGRQCSRWLPPLKVTRCSFLITAKGIAQPLRH
jgi:hypothetical protein